jgi:hypothetical protein
MICAFYVYLKKFIVSDWEVKTLAFRRRLSARGRPINFGDGGIQAGRTSAAT